MPKLSYGPAAKARTQQLLRSLINYGNDELWAAEDATLEEQEQFERALDGLRPKLSSHWQRDRSLIIRTKIRCLVQLSQLATPDQPLSTNQIKEALSHLNKFLGILEDNRTSRRGSDTWHFTLHLGVDRRDDEAFERWFSDIWARNHPKAKPASGEVVSPQVGAISAPINAKATNAEEGCKNAWQDLCRQDLNRRRHQELTTNPLTAQAGLSFSTEELYVPVALVRQFEAGAKSAAQDEAAPGPDEGASANLDISLEELLKHLLAKPQSRIAIIGEPGAGKTTLLQQAAAWILEQTDDLPLWVSLADLDSPKVLETYVFETWLKTALRQRTLPAERQTELEQQFAQGRVWLLLDAVDEMALPAGLVLSQLAKQLDGCLGEARILMTSRGHVWQGGHNALVEFEAYRLVGYDLRSESNPSQSQRRSAVPAVVQGQISTFVQGWFRDRPQTATNLLNELFRPERRRIRDAVRNPLRLALLCRCWSLGQGKLPETKALLYGQFVEAIYDWKQTCFPTTIAQRHQLNQVLGQIALAAMQRTRPLFRLPESLLFQALEQSGIDQPSWIDLVLQLGWLTRTADDGEASYRFYHATFQEYFAAQQIDSWRVFIEPLSLAESDGSASSSTTSFPTAIFSAAWREVILLWLGRPDIAQAEKAALMSYLINFEDDCGGFYAAQACLLAALGLAEFTEFEQRDAIADQLLHWRFNRDGQTPKALSQETQRVLSQSDQATVIAAFERLLQDPNLYPFKRWMAAYSLGKSYDPGNQLAIATLSELLAQATDWPIVERIELAKHLGVIDAENPQAIAALEAILEAPEPSDFQILRKAALRLGLIDPGNERAIAQLLQLLDDDPAPHARAQLLDDLTKIAPEHPRLAAQPAAPAADLQMPALRQRNRRRHRPVDRARAIASILNRLETTTRLEAKLRLAYRLGQYEPGHPVARKLLLQGLRDARQRSQLRRIPALLVEILLEAQLADLVAEIQPLHQNLVTQLKAKQSSSPVEWERAQACYSILWHCAQTLTYPVFRRAYHQR